MRRVEKLTARLDRLRQKLSPCFQRRGSASRLAKTCAVGKEEKRQQISLWFKKGVGRPTAKATLLALRFLFDQPEWTESNLHAPTWDELVQIIKPILGARGKAAALARFCDRKPHDISRYFSSQPSERREPDGEVALATLAWLAQHRLEWTLICNEDQAAPKARVMRAYEAAFARDEEIRERREQEEGRHLWHLFDDPLKQ